MTEVYGRVYHVIHPKDPGRVRYIGKTIGTIKRREQGHWSDTRRLRDNSRLQNWLVKYRDDREVIEFREAAVAYSKEELNALEMSHIADHRNRGEADLNITAGGDGGHGLPWSEESKAKLRATLGGEGAWKAKLTWGQVREIRRRYLSGEPWSEMLEEYGVARGTMQKLARNTTWKDPSYTPPVKSVIVARGDGLRAHLTRGQVKELRDRAQRELKTHSEWASEFSVSESVVALALQNNSHHDPLFNPQSALRKLPHRKLRVLTPDSVMAARDRARSGVTAKELAEEYSVGEGAIRDAVRGETWADLPGSVPEAFMAYRTKLRTDPVAVAKLQERYAAGGVSTAKLAKEYGVAISTIRSALLRGAI